MLKGISPLLSPDLLHALCCMGHGDEIVLADAHFPAYSYNQNVLRADGIKIPDLLTAMLPLFELDQYSEYSVMMMQAVKGDELDVTVEQRYRASFAKINSAQVKIERIERFAFYERAKNAFVVVVTGELAKYGNIILKKGVIQTV
jgi:L-fucose mutarotase